jgi:hypothetical protein
MLKSEALEEVWKWKDAYGREAEGKTAAEHIRQTRRLTARIISQLGLKTVRLSDYTMTRKRATV